MKSRLLSPQDDPVNLGLRLGESSGDRERARDVRGVHGELGAGIEKYELAASHPPIVHDVVKDTGVLPARYDRLVAISTRAEPAKRRFDLRL